MHKSTELKVHFRLGDKGAQSFCISSSVSTLTALCSRSFSSCLDRPGLPGLPFSHSFCQCKISLIKYSPRSEPSSEFWLAARFNPHSVAWIQNPLSAFWALVSSLTAPSCVSWSSSYLRWLKVAPGFAQAAPCTSSADPSPVPPSVDKPSSPQLFSLFPHCLQRFNGVSTCHWQPSFHFPTFGAKVPCIFFGKSISPPLTIWLALYTAPGVGPDWLKPTGVSCPSDTRIDSGMGTWPYAGIQLFPPAHNALESETDKAIFATTRRITLGVKPSQGKQIRVIDLRMSLSTGSSWAWRQISPGHCYVNIDKFYFLF